MLEEVFRQSKGTTRNVTIEREADNTSNTPLPELEGPVKPTIILNNPPNNDNRIKMGSNGSDRSQRSKPREVKEDVDHSTPPVEITSNDDPSPPQVNNRPLQIENENDPVRQSEPPILTAVSGPPEGDRLPSFENENAALPPPVPAAATGPSQIDRSPSFDDNDTPRLQPPNTSANTGPPQNSPTMGSLDPPMSIIPIVIVACVAILGAAMAVILYKHRKRGDTSHRTPWDTNVSSIDARFGDGVKHTSTIPIIEPPGRPPSRGNLSSVSEISSSQLLPKELRSPDTPNPYVERDSMDSSISQFDFGELSETSISGSDYVTFSSR